MTFGLTSKKTLLKMKIVRPRAKAEEVVFFREFVDKSDGSVYAFPCDQLGNELFSKDDTEMWRLYEACIYNPKMNVRHTGVQKVDRVYYKPAIVLCQCTRTLYCDLDDSPCECGRRYNKKGVELKDD